jgi:hypothetical protein
MSPRFPRIPAMRPLFAFVFTLLFVIGAIFFGIVIFNPEQRHVFILPSVLFMLPLGVMLVEEKRLKRLKQDAERLEELEVGLKKCSRL